MTLDPGPLLDEAVARRGSGYAGLAVAAFMDQAEGFCAAGRVERPPGPDTLFQIGSVTKVVTALLLADAAARGEVTLEEPVTTFVPELSAVQGGAAVTLAHLATHTSGLPRLPPGLLREGLRHREDPYRDLDAEALRWAVTRTRLRSTPGVRVRYSNYGAGLLGLALEVITGATYASLVADRVAAPLGLRDTVVTPRPDQADRRAVGHSRRGRPVPYWDLAALAGAGALFSTPHDLLRLLRAHLDPPAGTLGEAVRLVQQPRARAGRMLQVGLGWHLTPLPRTPHTVLWHNGGTGGFSSYVGMLPGALAGVVVLASTARPVDPIGQGLVHRLATDRTRT